MDPILTGSISANPADQVAAAVSNVDRMMEESRLALAALSEEAHSKTERLMDTLAGIGALSGVVDYAFAALLALVPGVAAGAIVFMLAARRCTAKSMRQPVSA